jgi:hypothetical protein
VTKRLSYECATCGHGSEGYTARRFCVGCGESPQPARCEVCGESNAGRQGLRRDHDHRSGLFRGWLCNGCNRGLGFFDDDPETLRRAADYLVGVRQTSPIESEFDWASEVAS